MTKAPKSSRIIVKGLGQHVTEDRIRDRFSEFGEVFKSSFFQFFEVINMTSLVSMINLSWVYLHNVSFSSFPIDFWITFFFYIDFSGNRCQKNEEEWYLSWFCLCWFS